MAVDVYVAVYVNWVLLWVSLEQEPSYLRYHNRLAVTWRDGSGAAMCGGRVMRGPGLAMFLSLPFSGAQNEVSRVFQPNPGPQSVYSDLVAGSGKVRKRNACSDALSWEEIWGSL